MNWQQAALHRVRAARDLIVDELDRFQVSDSVKEEALEEAVDALHEADEIVRGIDRAGGMCRAVHAGYICTRVKGHEGWHVAGVSDLGIPPIQVWSEDRKTTLLVKDLPSSMRSMVYAIVGHSIGE